MKFYGICLPGLLLMAQCIQTFAQSSKMPETEIWTAEARVKGGAIYFSGPVNFTDRTGYDNQPAFDSLGNIYYSSVRDQNGQADLYKYDPNTTRISRFTLSRESEYSPLLSPDKKFITSVVVEKDSTQRIWKYDVETGLNAILADPTTDSVGYYRWLSDSVYFFVKITSPLSLWIKNIASGKERRLADNVGRSLAVSREGLIYYTQLVDSTRWLCRKELSGAHTRLIEFPKGSEDFCMIKDGWVMCGDRGRLLYSDNDFSKGWRMVSDFTSIGIKKITRIAFSHDYRRIAFVVQQE